MQDVIEFLRQLRLHNDRTWFEANKSWYRDAQSQFAAFVEELIAGIARFDSSVQGLAQKIVPTGFIATHASAPTRPLTRPTWEHTVCRGGKSRDLRAIISTSSRRATLRAAICCRPESICRTGTCSKAYGRKYSTTEPAFEASVKRARGFRLYQGNKLKKFPAGFTTEGAYSDYLKLKDFYLEKFVDEDYMLQPDLARKAVADFKKTFDFNERLNRAAAYAFENR